MGGKRAIIWEVLLAASAVALSGAPPWSRPQQNSGAGCPMAHCNPRMSNLELVTPAPLSSGTYIRYHDLTPTAGAGTGLGCSSNGTVAVCSNKNKSGNNIVAYGSDGTRLWTSGSLLDSNSYASAPIVGTSGGVIAADDMHVIRFGSNGQVMWNTPTPGGIPISPIQTQAGTIVLSARGGPVSAFDSSTGALIGSLYIRDNPDDPNYFDTVNTPCSVGNRIYISTAKQNDPQNTGWLVAIDVDETNTASPLTIAWHFAFGGPSGASPMCYNNTIYFDGNSVNPGDPPSPQAFAVTDNGTTGTLLWNVSEPAKLIAAFAQDPRGGLWLYPFQVGTLERHSAQTGALIETINVSQLVNDPNFNYPYSAMIIVGTSSKPAMIVGTGDLLKLSSYILTIDLASHTTDWIININPTVAVDKLSGQFPIVVDSTGKSVIVTEGTASAAYFIAQP